MCSLRRTDRRQSKLAKTYPTIIRDGSVSGLSHHIASSFCNSQKKHFIINTPPMHQRLCSITPLKKPVFFSFSRHSFSSISISEKKSKSLLCPYFSDVLFVLTSSFQNRPTEECTKRKNIYSETFKPLFQVLTQTLDLVHEYPQKIWKVIFCTESKSHLALFCQHHKRQQRGKKINYIC